MRHDKCTGARHLIIHFEGHTEGHMKVAASGLVPPTSPGLCGDTVATPRRLGCLRCTAHASGFCAFSYSHHRRLSTLTSSYLPILTYPTVCPPYPSLLLSSASSALPSHLLCPLLPPCLLPRPSALPLPPCRAFRPHHELHSREERVIPKALRVHKSEAEEVN
ncbi:hypothetical protein E2C01_060272 [Portunus trituberculatus]|uniref:Uncharacterized protein n=1 Tax=Portunus trituberculatus TaxID=210409 RepID=A0A5B7H897_PORTR|nr:hypothetical protein [Portunus trituberculatus]